MIRWWNTREHRAVGALCDELVTDSRKMWLAWLDNGLVVWLGDGHKHDHSDSDALKPVAKPAAALSSSAMMVGKLAER